MPFLKPIGLLLPIAFLSFCALRATGSSRTALGIGLLVQLPCSLCLWWVGRKKPLHGSSIVSVYLVALIWLWLFADGFGDWYLHFAKGVLLAVPLALLSLQALSNSGGVLLRRARRLARQVADRADWPDDLFLCKNVAEVAALREALRLDPTPALNLVSHPKTAVRVAALSALEFRKNWRPEHVEFILDTARQTDEPAIRAAAIKALANVEDRLVIESLADFVSDPSLPVRRATIEALLWDGEHRWPWIRVAVRRALSDPAFQGEGLLQVKKRRFPAEAVGDLQAWANEKGVLGQRAAQALAGHYQHSLDERPDEGMVEDLQRQVADYHAPAALRLELARLFDSTAKWPVTLLRQLLEPANPAPLRLLAAEILLQTGEDGGATAALYEIARLPNREIALATAAIVQRYLGVDLGLPLNQPLPPLNSRQAIEVTRRVLEWADHKPANLLGTPSSV